VFEHGDGEKVESSIAYMQEAGKQHIALYKMLFEHGLGTIIAPMFGGELFNRGEDYVAHISAQGLAYLATNPDFLTFYHEWGVRVRFYGDYHRQLAQTPYSYLAEVFDRIGEHTQHNSRFRLFYGVYANDPAEQVAEIGVHYFQKHGRIPGRNEIVRAYYGEEVQPVNIFVGFDKLSVFDYPLLNLGEEDLYFTVAPSLYLTERQLREILFDHLYTRRGPMADYTELSPEQQDQLRSYYQTNREKTLGVGVLREGIWLPG
jgi:hypothetical protein